jgi:hypothetical protein
LLQGETLLAADIFKTRSNMKWCGHGVRLRRHDTIHWFLPQPKAMLKCANL